MQSPRHWGAQRREKCLFRNQIVENRPEPLHDLAPRVLEPRSSSNFPLSRNFDPSPFVNPPSHRSIPLLIYIYIYIDDHRTKQRREEEDALHRHRRSNFLSAELNRHRIGFQPGKITGETSEISRSVPSPQSFWFIHRENVFERTGGRECDRIGFWTFDIVSRINKIRRYARVFVDFYEFLTKHQITVSVLKLLFFQTVIFTMIFKYVLRCYLSNILI